jgi:hypothetical protein
MAKKAKTLDGTIIDCMDGLFSEWFPGDTWMSWRSIPQECLCTDD